MKKFHNLSKRIFDLLFSIVGIVLLSPLLAVIAIAIRIDTRGPVIFRQPRIGKGGKHFNILKFRSMVVNAEKMGTGLFNFANDPRVTRVGRFLRNTSFDELPQFFNILKGEMSFVGPRPPVTYELGKPEDWDENLWGRCEVKPGVTGYAQINGRNELSRDEKTIFDLHYIRDFYRWGLLLDIGIIFVTLYKIFIMEGKYELPENMEADGSRIIDPDQSNGLNHSK
jgi:lipopolysaccharide/colanic/teichoic acid biosynthesis glycosyltransferase